MSWTDDIRCLHCDGRLPLYRKITNGQFCSATHRKAYWQEQERLAVERLHQTHDSLQAYRPRGPVEAIIGRENPQAEAIDKQTERPDWLVRANTGDVPFAGLLPISDHAQPRWMPDRVEAGNPQPIDSGFAPRNPAGRYSTYDCGFRCAGTVGIPFTGNIAAQTRVSKDLSPVKVTLYPVYNVRLAAAPQPEELAPAGLVAVAIEDPAPLSEALFPLPAIGLQECSKRSEFLLASPIRIEPRVQLPPDAAQTSFASVALMLAGLRELPVDRAPVVGGLWIDSLRALDLRETVDPLLALSTPPLRPRLRLAAGRRYPVQTRASAAAAAGGHAGFTQTPPVISLPERKAKLADRKGAFPDRKTTAMRAPAGAAVENARAIPQPNFEPGPTGLLPLACSAQPALARDILPAPAALSIPQPPRTEPVRPVSKLQPLDPQPGAGTADFVITPPPYLISGSNPDAAETPAERPGVWAHAWKNTSAHTVAEHAVDFWNRAPRDLKMLVFAIPLLLGLALHPALPKIRVAAPAAATGIEHDLQQVVNARWTDVKQTVFDRAAVALNEDFRSGLDDWTSRGDATATWSFDATGFVQPGPLALYRPSLGLTDYQLQFLGMIDDKALSWVVRAADFDNYYVVKLVVLKAGPLPTIGLTRYAVVDGKADARADTIVPIDARTDMLYRIRMDVRGDDFALSIQGQMIDAWSEPRLRHGGVGFFSARGEQSRVRWIQVTHQYDMLGRLCAYLAPYDNSNTSGGE